MSTYAGSGLNPVIPGFNPDPSVVKVGSDYFLTTSTFEYLPALPIYHSTDLFHWEQIGNVVDRKEQLDLSGVRTGAGVWAPTIRHRGGCFYVIVTILGVGCVLFTAEDARGPWSAGRIIDGIHGIDPDLAWDDEGQALVTFGGWMVSGPDAGGPHQGILQARVDLERSTTLEQPRFLWSGSPGLDYEEAPHLYKRGDFWYLLISEGGTSRGHCVSIARSTSATGPFEPCPYNPILSARSTARKIQATGHGDLVEMPDGSTAMVLLGVRPFGSVPLVPLGRETFSTEVSWAEGWPVVGPVASPRQPEGTQYFTTFDSPLDHGWIAVRRPATDFTITSGRLVITADGSTLRDLRPTFVGRRQTDLTAEVSAICDVSEGTGGLALRYDENHFLSVDATETQDGNHVVARAVLSDIEQTWEAVLPKGPITLSLVASASPGAGEGPARKKGHLELSARAGDVRRTLATVDGRYFTADVADTFFTGRVVGLYASTGRVGVSSFRYQGVPETEPLP